MSSYDKVVKLACKPKAAPPKAKYLDPIIAATWSEDGAVHDVCKALSPRFREPNAIVVFKALIVLHTMIRNGATDNVLSYLSSSEVLRLSNVSAGNWEGYRPPDNLQNYAAYLESRIRAYKDLKHDAVRVQAESNRDMRTSQSIEEEGYRVKKGVGKHAQSAPPTRSKTIMGRKLRVMTVEKGLLRETKAVHRMIDALVECRFYLDNLEDELNITALRMLVKDLLILFQAGNEGVINVLEHYFEMSHVDAEQALALYRHFCKQTECVVEFLGVAKKLQNLLNVPIPNLKHAPVSLAGALQEYLDDPNFEQNRIEYKTNKDSAERSARKGSSTIKKVDKTAESRPSTAPSSSSSAPLPSNNSSDSSKANPVVDFFSAIEEEQPTMFNPATNSPSSAYFQQQGAANPFVQMQMATGQPFAMQPQPTGFPMGGGAPNPFGLQASPSAPSHLRPQPTGQPGGHRPFTSFIPNGQMPGANQGFLQPQLTGANPFRQSVLVPQTTGMAMFGVGGPGIQPQNTATPFMNSANTGMVQAQPGFGGSPFGIQSNMNGQPGMNGQLGMNGQPGQPGINGQTGMNGQLSMNGQSNVPGQWNMNGQPGVNGQPFANPSPSFSTLASQSSTVNGRDVPARPASTPLTSLPSTFSSTSPPTAQPVKTHQTGTRNPFGRVVTPPPPVPKQPTLMELAMGMGTSNMNGNAPQSGDMQPSQSSSSQNGFAFSNSALNPGATDISSIASSFSFSKPSGSEDQSATSTSSFSPGGINSQNTSTTMSSMFSDSLWSSSLSSQQTGATNTTNTSSAPSISLTPALKPQTTGFSGLKPFKPSSSFGASLMESLPPIPGSAPATPSITGTAPQLGNSTTGTPSGSAFGNQLSSGPNSSLPLSGNNPSFSIGSGLGSQPTGFSRLNTQPTGMPSFSSGATTGQGLRPQMTGSAANPFRASMVNGNTTGGMPAGGMPMFTGAMGQQSGNMFGMQSNNAFAPNFTNGGQQQQQQSATTSLI